MPRPREQRTVGSTVDVTVAGEAGVLTVAPGRDGAPCWMQLRAGVHGSTVAGLADALAGCPTCVTASTRRPWLVHPESRCAVDTHAASGAGEVCIGHSELPPLRDGGHVDGETVSAVALSHPGPLLICLTVYVELRGPPTDGQRRARMRSPAAARPAPEGGQLLDQGSGLSHNVIALATSSALSTVRTSFSAPNREASNAARCGASLLLVGVTAMTPSLSRSATRA